MKENYSDSLEITLPLFLVNNLMLQKISKIELNKYNLTNSEFDVLITTLVSGDEEYKISPTILYEKLLFSTGAITKILNKLEDKKLISRIENEFDKRSKLLQLTPLGKETCEKLFVDISSFQESIYSVLTKNEREIFIKALYKMVKEL
ncbi:MarR family transcriptional regulator [Arcobacter lacus]|uniref:MarR family winged helix-turn-helix transcriptional regulator n=1 Tax=Arcobacter lacus TaxID=1912876 RepID=UPI0021BADD23|nr:MarR family transcriptional regulator [Arcobacter lacus]MCT7908199.1 MarR family transcriptional regulator [Arcobacter lacus]MCT7912022.1 MarR family transcriptional regulator [Arcobacter lacus]